MPSPQDFNKSLHQTSEQLLTGSGMEAFLFGLRQKGADKIDSIKILKTAMNVSMAQAKSLVDRSETWSDRYADDHAFHEAVREVAEKLKNESGGIEVVIEDRSIDPVGG